MNTIPTDLCVQAHDLEFELPAIGFLSDVSCEHRAFLACFGKFLRLNSGDTLIKEGGDQESLYLILSGIRS